MRAAIDLLARLLARDEEGGDHVLEYLVILGLIVVAVILAFVFLGDAIADLISLIGGRVDEETLGQ